MDRTPNAVAHTAPLFDDGFWESADEQVFACRIAGHTARRPEDDRRGNYFTIYLLLGSRRSIELKLFLVDNLWTGRLAALTHDNLVNEEYIVRYIDIPTARSPDDFDPETTPRRVGRPTPGEFVDVITNSNYHMLRCMQVNHRCEGNRAWM